MKLHLVSAYDVHPGLDTLIQCASEDSVNQHSICASPEESDAIVFVENTQFDDLMFKRLREHKLTKAHLEKVFMYNEMDRPWDVLPGVYTCMTRKHMNALRHRPFPYLSTPNPCISDIHMQPSTRRWLFSFMGAMSHACRRDIMRLKDDQAYLKDTSEFNVWNTSDQELGVRAKDYASVLSGSEFVLCPRGIGTSSIRLYETLEAGRAPVIISDQWSAPEGTDWRFALQVQERQISTLPGLLKSLQSEALERGAAAREAWLASYSPSSLFNSLGDAISSIAEKNGHSSRPRNAQWNKWVASGGLMTRTAVQKLRGQR